MIACENDGPVGTVDFVFPGEGDAEPTVARDRRPASRGSACFARFAVKFGLDYERPSNKVA